MTFTAPFSLPNSLDSNTISSFKPPETLRNIFFSPLFTPSLPIQFQNPLPSHLLSRRSAFHGAFPHSFVFNLCLNHLTGHDVQLPRPDSTQEAYSLKRTFEMMSQEAKTQPWPSTQVPDSGEFSSSGATQQVPPNLSDRSVLILTPSLKRLQEGLIEENDYFLSESSGNGSLVDLWDKIEIK
jgi:hypothetical protein